MKWRQEVVNVRLSDILNEIGVETKAEERYGTSSPDFICRHPRIGRIIGEAEYEAPNARKKLEKRVEDRFSDLMFNDFDAIFLVVYPLYLRTEKELKKALVNSMLEIGLASRKEACIKWHESKIKPRQIPQAIEDLSRSLPGLDKIPQDIAISLVRLIETSPEAVRVDGNWRTTWKDVGRHFEIDPGIFEDESKFIELVIKTFFILAATSLMIYELSRRRWFGSEAQTSPQGLRNSLSRLRKINYSESLELIMNVLNLLPSDPDLERHLKKVYTHISTNAEVFRRSGWEVLTYVYQTLLSKTYRDAYATFYTKFPAASLLSRLAIDDPSASVIDPACGTGSLLLASYNRRMWLSLGKTPRPGKTLIEDIGEDILTKTAGLDALNASKNIAGAVLTIASLAIPREPLSLYHVPVGRDSAGSLNLFHPTLTNLKKKLQKKYSLVIMNPPFTRSDRIPNLIGEEARKWLTKAKLRFGDEELSNIFAAGLAKPFMSLADNLSEKTIAAVLPNSLLNRSAWREIREEISRSWTIEYLVLSWGRGTPNFSSQTDFREILCVIGRKEDREDDLPLRVINLLKPIDEMDEGDVTLVELAAKRGKQASWRKGDILATINSFSQKDIKNWKDNLYRLVAFLDPKISELHKCIIEKSKRFGKLFEIGSEVDHKAGLEIDLNLKELPRRVKHAKAVWGSGEHALVKKIRASPKHRVIAIDEKRAVVRFWREHKTFYKSNIFFLRRGQLDTQYVLAFRTDKPAVSNVWWPLKTNAKGVCIDATLLFLNSVFGLIHLLGERLETRGLWVEYKKGHLHDMFIPFISENRAKKIFRKISKEHKISTSDLLDVEFKKRLGHYLEAMVELEKEEGDYRKALSRAVSEDLDHRAKIDLFAIEMMDDLGIGIEKIIGKNLYEAILIEVNALIKIMDSKRTSNDIKDKGKIELDFIFQKRLEDF